MKTIIAVLALCAFAAPAKAETVRVTVSYYSAVTGPYFEKMAAESYGNQAEPAG